MIMNGRVLAMLTAALLPVLCLSRQASAQEAGDVVNGGHIATTICAACHLVGKGEMPAPGPGGSAPPFARIAATPGMTSMALNAMLLTSHRQMPNIILQPDENGGT